MLLPDIAVSDNDLTLDTISSFRSGCYKPYRVPPRGSRNKRRISPSRALTSPESPATSLVEVMIPEWISSAASHMGM